MAKKKFGQGITRAHSTMDTRSSRLPKNLAPVEKCWINIKVAEAKDLLAMDVNGTSDPYVKIMADSKKIFRTKTIDRSLTPSWMQEYHETVPDGTKAIKFVVYDQDLLGGDDFIGEWGMSLRAIKAQRNVDGWFKLQPKGAGLESKEIKKKRGSIRIRMECMTAYLLPPQYTKDLVKHISQPSIAHVIDAALNKKGPGAKKPIFRSIVAVLHLVGEALPYICNLVKKEIEDTSAESIIFRKNSVASIVVDAYLNIIGFDALNEALREPVYAIYKDTSSYEVDPTLDKSKIAKRQKNLLARTEMFWNAILEVEPSLPRGLRQVLNEMRHGVQDKWGAQTPAAYSAPSGFIFLRFFCPAILSPSLYGLADDLPKPVCARTLKLISKILMTMANSSTFGRKEPYMAFANDFINANTTSLKSFIDNAVNPAKGGPQGSPKYHAKPIVLDEAIAHVQSALWNNVEELRQQPQDQSTKALIDEITKLAHYVKS